MSIKTLSLHPKFTAIVDIVVGILFLWGLSRFTIWWLLLAVVLLRLVWWGFVLRLTYYPAYIQRLWHFFTLTIFHLGSVFLLLFLEWPVSWWMTIVVYLLFPVISFWLLPAKSDNQLSFVTKPYRRARFWMNLFGLFGIWSGVFAMVSLQIFSINYWYFMLSAVAITVFVGAWWWREYNITVNQIFYWWSACLGVIVLEIAWVLFRWSLGYFASALVLTWLWYDIWLMARFHLLPLGINWKKQISFFIINGFLLTTFLLFIVKWK